MTLSWDAEPISEPDARKLPLPFWLRCSPASCFQSCREPVHAKNPWSQILTVLVISFLSQLVPLRTFALDPSKSVYQFNCQNWTRQNGLPADKINAVTQTDDGYLWLGTQNGLVRFDGNEFTSVPIDLPSIQNQDIKTLSRAGNGGIWFAINNGGFAHYRCGKFSLIEDDRWLTPWMSALTILEVHDGSLWTGSIRGAGHYVKGKPAESMFDETIENVSAFCEDSLGRIWIGTVERGLFYCEKGKVHRVPNDVLRKSIINALVADREGQIWVGTNSGVLCYDAQVQRREIPAINTSIHALLVDRQGTIWLGTSNLGLTRCRDGQYTHLKKSDGLGSDFVTSLFEDVEGSLWIGTRDGLSQLTDTKLPIFSDKEGLTEGSSHTVSASRNGGLWITTNLGVSYFDGKVIRNDNELGLANSYVKLGLETKNGDLYLLDGDKNINVISDGTIAMRFPNTAWPTSFAEDAESVLVAITGNLFRIRDGELKPYVYGEGQERNCFWIRNLTVSRDGAIWVASTNGVVRLIDGNSKQWSTSEGLSGNDTNYIIEDEDGSMWIGLSTGIARIKNHKIKNIRRADGLHDDRIYAIVPDNRGSFWMASGRGVFQVSRHELNNFADGNSNHIRSIAYDGLESTKFSDRSDQEYSGCKTLDGRIWFPNQRGVMMIDPARVAANPIIPPVHIERVKGNGVNLPIASNAIVPAGKGEMEFHFGALSFIAPKKLKFRYRLDGYDKDWVEAHDRRVAFYTNLSPGKYTFRVIAANSDGVWNLTGDKLRFELLPHFYQTAVFKLLWGGLTCAALAGVYAWRTRNLNRKQRALLTARDLLETEVQKRTAELASANTSLKDLVDVHQRTGVQLELRSRSLENEIEERRRVKSEHDRVHQQLIITSRQAGMAEIATNVLHNVGNVLNSVNVSAGLVAASVKKSKAANLTRVVDMLREHEADLGTFLTSDPRGSQLPNYLAQLSDHVLADRDATLNELNLLRGNIDHIKHIVAMQQCYAKVSDVKEIVNIISVVDDSVRMNIDSLNRHEVEVVREFEDVPPLLVDKHKTLQILVNLIRNAKHACCESGREDRQLTMKVASQDGHIRISVIDNGVGIPPENLTRIFSHGFTTRKSGHGFGLHSGALAAKEMGGSLSVQSTGLGQGAAFTLELPLSSTEKKYESESSTNPGD